VVTITGCSGEGEMDLLLLNPPSYDLIFEGRGDNRVIPAYGLGILATISKKASFKVGVIDAEAQGIGNLDEIANTINKVSPRFLGIGVSTPSYESASYLCRHLDPRISIILGGAHSSSMYESVFEDLKNTSLAFIVRGPGEEAINPILKNAPKEDIPNVVYRDLNGDLKVNALKKVNPIESYPLVDRDFFVNDPGHHNGKIISFLLSSRGCYHDCTFCSIRATWNQPFQSRNLDHLASEIKTLNSRGVDSFGFLDDLFLTSPRMMYSFYESLRTHNLLGKITWASNSRVDVINRFTDKDLESLLESGCATITLGIESGTDTFLKKIKKGITIAESTQAVGKLTGAGIGVRGNFIIGFPEETEDEMRQTSEYALGLKRDFGAHVNLVPYKLFPGSSDFLRIAGPKPTKEYIDRLIKFKAVNLGEQKDDPKVVEKFKKRARFITMHDPSYFNPSIVDSETIKEIIRNFVIREIE